MHTASTLWLIFLIATCAISCTPIPQASISSHQPSFPKIAEPVTQPESIQRAIATHPISAPAVASKTLSNIQFQGVSFDSRSHTLKPIDQANGPGTQYLSARDCATKQQALLAINAGFFTPEGEPLGLVISNKKKSGSWNSSSSLGSGIYHIDPSGIAYISRRTQANVVSNSKELLQAGPLLIENHQPITGLDPSKIAMRSILLRHRLTLQPRRTQPSPFLPIPRRLENLPCTESRRRTIDRSFCIIRNLRRNPRTKKHHEPPSQEFSRFEISVYIDL
jgi:hypothetical protein